MCEINYYITIYILWLKRKRNLNLEQKVIFLILLSKVDFINTETHLNYYFILVNNLYP